MSVNNNEWGLTERGFRRPTYVELLDALEYKALKSQKQETALQRDMSGFLPPIL